MEWEVPYSGDEESEGFYRLDMESEGSHSLDEESEDTYNRDEEGQVPFILVEEWKVPYSSHEIFYDAAANGNTAIVLECLQKGVPVSCTGSMVTTALSLAVEKNEVEIVKILLEADADPSPGGVYHCTPLHFASQKGFDETVKLLLNAGSDVTPLDYEKQSPLHWAAENGHFSTVKILLEAGSHVFAKDSNGDLPFNLAENNGHDRTAALLLNFMRYPSAADERAILTKEIEDPDTIRGLGIQTAESFLDIMKLGKYKYFWNRVYLVGPYGVGKSTLARVLVGEVIPFNREATDGIWIYIGRAGMHIKSKEWKYFPKGNATFEIISHMLMSIHVERSGLLPELYTYLTETKQVVESPSEDDDLSSNESESFKVQYNFGVIEHKHEKMIETSSLESSIQDYQIDTHDNTRKFSSKLPQTRNFKDAANPSNQSLEYVDTNMDENDQAFDEENILSFDRIHKRAILAVKEGKYIQNIIPIDIWDFGGHKDYYMTHQLFITSRGIFVLMFNGSVSINKHKADLSFLPGHFGRPTIAVYLLHWVNSVLTYCKRSGDGFPRIIFLATHKDKLPQKKIEKHRQTLINELRELFRSHPCINHLEIESLLFLNTTDPHDDEIEELQERIMARASQNPQWGEEMPTAWIPLELQLVHEMELGENIISREYLYELNSKNQEMVLTEAQLETFLKVQHSLGKLLYFDNVNLRKFIIINPAFLVDVLRSIVTENQFWPKDKKLVAIFKRLQKHGMIAKEDIYNLWNQEQFRQILSSKEFMINILIHLDVLINPCSGELMVSTDSIADDLIVPCMITRPNDTKYLSKFCTNVRSIILSYTFVEKVIPPAMVYRFLGSFINMWKIKTYKGRRMLFNDLAVAEVDKDHDIAVQIQGNRLVVYLVHSEKKENIVPTLASTIQECLTAAIFRITEFYVTLSSDMKTPLSSSRSHHQFSEKYLPDTVSTLEATSSDVMSEVSKPFRIEFGVYCYKFFQTTKVCFFPHSVVAQWKCPTHRRQHNLQYLTLWFAEKSPAAVCSESCIGLGHLELSQCPSEKQLRRLTNRLTPNQCREIFITLGMDSCIWEKLRDEYQNTDDVMFMAVLKWKEGNKNATFIQLQDAFKRCDADLHILCEVFRDINPDVSEYDEENLKKTPSDRSLLELSNHIGNSSIHLGIELGMQMTTIQTIQYQYKNKLLDQIKEILRIWKRQSNPKPTVHVLIKAVHRIGKSNCLRGIHFT